MHVTNKPFQIEKRWVYEAYQAIRSNGKAAGVDGQTLEQFEADLSRNLYKIWNRMSSGTYFSPPVRAVPIPKKSGGERILGVPTVADRGAQMVVKRAMESTLESIFLADSYGYRPHKSALDAVGATRARCWKYDWILDSTSGACSTTWTTSFCYGPSGSMSRVKGRCCTSKDGSKRLWGRRMEPRWSETAVRRKAAWSAPFWPISFFTTRSMSG